MSGSLELTGLKYILRSSRIFQYRPQGKWRSMSPISLERNSKPACGEEAISWYKHSEKAVERKLPFIGITFSLCIRVISIYVFHRHPLICISLWSCRGRVPNHSNQKFVQKFSFIPYIANKGPEKGTDRYLPNTLHLLKILSCDPGHLAKKYDPHVSANLENLEHKTNQIY